MQSTEGQALVQKFNLIQQRQEVLISQLQKRLLTTSDRKFLYDLVTKVARPAIVYANINSGAIALVAASQIVVNQNELRWACWVVNAGVNDAFLTFGDAVAVATAGGTLKPGGTAVFGRGTDSPHLGTVTGISNSAGTTLTFVEWSLPATELEF